MSNNGFYLLPSDPALALDVYKDAANDSDRSTISQRIANGIFANRLPKEVVSPKTGMATATFGYMATKYSSNEVRDGTSQTILFVENSNNLSWRDISITDDSSRLKVGCVWLYVGDRFPEDRPQAQPPSDEMRINHNSRKTGNSPARARPNSFHSAVVNAAMADGSTRVISDQIEYHIYQALMTPNGRKSDMPYNYLLRDDDFAL